jgi:O-antigen/teichoic acid export membrane protein
MSSINLKKNIVMSGSFRLIITIVMFFTSWISRYLGVELKGRYSYLATMSGFIWMVLDFGIYRSYPYFIRKFPDRVAQLFSWSLLQFIVENIFFGIIGLAAMDGISRLFDFCFSPLYMIIFVLMITCAKFNAHLQALYMGMDKILDHSLSQFSGALLVLLALLMGFFVLDVPDRLLYVLLAVLLTPLFGIVYFILRTQWGRVFRAFDFSFLKLVYTYGFRVFLSSFFILMLLRFDIILIKRYLGFSDVGIYSVAAHIIDLLQIASNVVGGLLLVKLTDSEDMEQKWHIMRRLMVAFSLVLLVANLGFVIVGRFLLATLFGADFVPVYGVYLWLIPASFSLSFGSLFNNYLNSKGFPIISIILPAIALALNIGLNLVLIPIWGIMGAALATSVAYTLWFISIIAYEQRCTDNRLVAFLIPRKEDFRELLAYAKILLKRK